MVHIRKLADFIFATKFEFWRRDPYRRENGEYSWLRERRVTVAGGEREYATFVAAGSLHFLTPSVEFPMWLLRRKTQVSMQKNC